MFGGIYRLLFMHNQCQSVNKMCALRIARLTGNGYQIEVFGKCFYYGYEFADHIKEDCG